MISMLDNNDFSLDDGFKGFNVYHESEESPLNDTVETTSLATKEFIVKSLPRLRTKNLLHRQTDGARVSYLAFASSGR